MKKIQHYFTILFLVFISIACGNSNGEKNEEKQSEIFNITAKIDELNFQKAYLAKYEAGDFVKMDSTTIKEGRFSFSGTVSLPEVYYMLFDDSDDRISLFVENSDISVTGPNLERENITVTGSVVHAKLKEFNEQLASYNDKLDTIYTNYKSADEKGDKALVEELGDKYDNQDSLKNMFIDDYINKNLNSVVSAYLALRYSLSKLDLVGIEALSKRFSDELRNSNYVQQIDERIEILKKTAIGQPAPLFTQNDKDGNPISLESFKGNYLLVDFWASWCGPCRGENPNVVAAYKKYHDKGFDILGVSFDNNKEKWLVAVEKDGLTWSHVSDLKGWENAAGKIYGIRSIPHSVLLDKDGVIIGENLRGEELQNKLAEIFNTNS